jgi:Flp pilus assembly protein TadG
MLRKHRRAGGQALVEFTLAATLIFFLLAAAVDLGLIFFTLQGMRTAAQEGAAFGSYPVQVLNNDGSINSVDLNYLEIRNRVRDSSGTGSGGFANLQDLDNNGYLDRNETSNQAHVNSKNTNAWIYVQLLGGPNAANLTGTCATSTRGTGMQNGGKNCWIRVRVRYTYRFQFPFAPSFADTVQLEVVQTMPIRSSYYNG